MQNGVLIYNLMTKLLLYFSSIRINQKKVTPMFQNIVKAKLIIKA